MDNGKSIVYICTHPDDISSSAGTLIKLRQKGYKIYDFCLTKGQKGGRQPDIAEIRTKEEETVCSIIGAELRMYDQMDGEVFATRELCEKIGEQLKEINPAAVITLWAFEKPDHTMAFTIAQKALHLADLYWTSEFYCCQADRSGQLFHPDLYVNISDVIDSVRKIVYSYPSQFNPETAEGIIGIKRNYGNQAWCDYAEGYKVVLPMVNERWNRRTEVGRVLLDL